MQKGASILISILFITYIGMVMFFCFYNFTESTIDLGKYFLGIRGDRYAHFIMFFPYPFITWLAINYSVNNEKWHKYSISLTFFSGLVFAISTELIQCYLLPHLRQGELFDFVADGVGIALGTIIVVLIGHWMVSIVNKIFTPRHEKD